MTSIPNITENGQGVCPTWNRSPSAERDAKTRTETNRAKGNLSNLSQSGVPSVLLHRLTRWDAHGRSDRCSAQPRRLAADIHLSVILGNSGT